MCITHKMILVIGRVALVPTFMRLGRVMSIAFVRPGLVCLGPVGRRMRPRL